MVQVIGLDPAFNESPHQRFQRRGIVIDAAQQHRLAHHRNAGIDDAGAGRARLAGQFPGVIGVQRNPGRCALDLQCGDHLAADARGIGDRHPGMNPDDLDVIDGGKIRHDLGEPSRRQHQGIAAGQDHFPYFRMRRGYSRARRDRRPAKARSPCPGRPFRGESKSGNTPRRHGPA